MNWEDNILDNQEVVKEEPVVKLEENNEEDDMDQTSSEDETSSEEDEEEVFPNATVLRIRIEVSILSMQFFSNFWLIFCQDEKY